MIYLDFAASTPLHPSVKEVLFRAFEEEYANPSAAHKLGRLSTEHIENSRNIIASSIGAYKSEIIFTSGASESNNLAIKGYALANKNKGKHIITSAIEHKCILAICHFLEKEYGFEITYISPKSNGIVDAIDVINAMRQDTILVSIMHVNNELGSIQPIKLIGEACFERNIKFHVDAAQSYKKIPINVDDLNIDMLSISAHKIYGPKGIGALYIRDLRENNIQPIIHGAGQEFSVRGGTLATPLILGFSEAVREQTIEDNIKKVSFLNKQLREIILKKKWIINSPENSSIDHIINLQIPKFNADLFISNSLYLCSKASSCSNLNIEPSHVLREIGISLEDSISCIRISIDHTINLTELENLISEIEKSIP